MARDSPWMILAKSSRPMSLDTMGRAKPVMARRYVAKRTFFLPNWSANAPWQVALIRHPIIEVLPARKRNRGLRIARAMYENTDNDCSFEFMQY